MAGDTANTICAPASGTRDVLASEEFVVYLVVVDGDDAGRRIPLGPEPVTAGRDPHLEIVLSGNAVSRLHCLVTAVEGAVIVEDLGSTNGTFINGQRLRTRGALPVGGIDLSRVTFIGSMGIRLFITAARSMRPRQTRLALYGAQPMVGEVFESVSMNSVLPIVSTEADAIAALTG